MKVELSLKDIETMRVLTEGHINPYMQDLHHRLKNIQVAMQAEYGRQYLECEKP